MFVSKHHMLVRLGCSEGEEDAYQMVNSAREQNMETMSGVLSSPGFCRLYG